MSVTGHKPPSAATCVGQCEGVTEVSSSSWISCLLWHFLCWVRLYALVHTVYTVSTACTCILCTLWALLPLAYCLHCEHCFHLHTVYTVSTASTCILSTLLFCLQIHANLNNMLSNISSKSRVEVIGIELGAQVLKTVAAYLDVSSVPYHF